MTSATDDAKRDELAELYAALTDEVRHVLRNALKEDGTSVDFGSLSAPDRRALVRAVFAFIEAMAFGLKQFALDTMLRHLSPSERALCREESYELNDEGVPLVRAARLRFLANLRFAFTIVPKVSQTPFVLDVGGPGWQAVRDSLKVRDRLMHPKTTSDLAVSDHEVQSALSAFMWTQREMVRLLIQVIKTTWANNDRMRERLGLPTQHGLPAV